MEVYQGKSVFGGIAIGRISVHKKDEQQVKRVKIENPGLTVRWCAPGPHRLRWNWRCVWHRAKSLPGRRPSPQPSSRTTKRWLHWMRCSSGKNQK